MMAPAGAKARKQESCRRPGTRTRYSQPHGPPQAKIPFRFLRICFLPTGQSGAARAFRFPIAPTQATRTCSPRSPRTPWSRVLGHGHSAPPPPPRQSGDDVQVTGGQARGQVRRDGGGAPSSERGQRNGTEWRTRRRGPAQEYAAGLSACPFP